MTVVYLDSLFLLNWVLDYLLLLATAKVTGRPFSRVRLALAAGLGAGYAAALFLPGLGFLGQPPVKVGAGVLMVLIAYGQERRLFRLTLVFFALACALGGGIFMIGLLGGGAVVMENGVPCTRLDVKVLLLSAAGCYGVFSLVFRKAAAHSPGRELVKVEVRLGEARVKLTALLDTGNTLTGPGGGRVMVADWLAVKPVLPPFLTREMVQNPVEAMEAAGSRGGRLHLLPYQAVGVERGLLLAVRTDEVSVEGEREKGMLVALSPTPVSDGGGYQAVLGL